MNSSNPCHRRQLGWIHFREGQYPDAFSEWPYGFFLAPMDGCF
jgi:hypothetical protein